MASMTTMTIPTADELGIPDADLLAPFVVDLYRVAHGAGTGIRWRDDTTFTVEDPPTFVAQVLPLVANAGSFKAYVRQLNTYGFGKVAGPADARGPCTFRHREGAFRQHAPATLHLIKRKGAKRKRKKAADPTASVRDARKDMAIMSAEVEGLMATRAKWLADIAHARDEHARMLDQVRDLEMEAASLRAELADARTEQRAITDAVNALRGLLPSAVGVAAHPARPSSPSTPLANTLMAGTWEILGFNPEAAFPARPGLAPDTTPKAAKAATTTAAAAKQRLISPSLAPLAPPTFSPYSPDAFVGLGSPAARARDASRHVPFLVCTDPDDMYGGAPPRKRHHGLTAYT